MRNNHFIKTYSPIVLLVVIITIFLYIALFQSDSKHEDHALVINNSLPEVVVSMDEKGFSPNTVNIKVGQKVTWVNSEVKERWPAADLHPTHSLYPGSSITKCGTEEEPYIFDACKGIKAGESYSFVFSSEGEWEYHDHLYSRLLGKVVVAK